MENIDEKVEGEGIGLDHWQPFESVCHETSVRSPQQIVLTRACIWGPVSISTGHLYMFII